MRIPDRNQNTAEALILRSTIFSTGATAILNISSRDTTSNVFGKSSNRFGFIVSIHAPLDFDIQDNSMPPIQKAFVQLKIFFLI